MIRRLSLAVSVAGIAPLAAGLLALAPTTAQAGVAPPSPTCLPRSSAIPQDRAVLQHQQVVAGTGGRIIDVTLHSPALNGSTHLDVMLPPGYDSSGRTHYPVLYLLHGASGSYRDWVSNGVEQLVDHTDASLRLRPFITVMPDGGLFGFYTDWYGSDVDGHSPNPPPAWETYHMRELIPWIDSHYPTVADRSGRAIAGLSMGGFGAMTYAAKHPDLFAAAGSFSGAVDTDYNYPYANEILTDFSSAFTGGPPDHCIWGDAYTQDLHWRAADATYIAGNLRGVSLYLACGNGKAGPLDNPNSPALYAQESVEEFVWPMNLALDAVLNADGIAHVDDFYGNGTHAWPYWLRDLTHFLPQMNGAFKAVSLRTAPPSFDYWSAANQFSVWGWRFASHRAVPEFTYLSDVSRGGFEVSGSGLDSVVTAPLYRPGAPAKVTIGTTAGTVVADRLGRLAFDVNLGPAHTLQQTDFSGSADASWAHVTVTIATPAMTTAETMAATSGGGSQVAAASVLPNTAAGAGGDAAVRLLAVVALLLGLGSVVARALRRTSTRLRRATWS